MISNSPASQKRFNHGRQARLRAEVFCDIQSVPIHYSCIYLRTEHARDHKRGWDSVTAIDIDVAVKKVKKGTANLEPRTRLALMTLVGSNP